MATVVAGVVTKFSADTAVFQSDLAKAAAAVQSSQSKMNIATARIERGFNSAFRVIRGFFGVFTVAAAARAGIGALKDLGDLFDNAQAIGITAENLQDLQFAFKKVGIESDKSIDGIKRFIKNLGDAAVGQGKLKQVLDQYNISAGQSPIDVLKQLADATAGASTQAEKFRIAVAAFGKGGEDFAGVLQKGSGALQRWVEESEKAGRASNELVEQGKRLEDQYNQVAKSLDTLWKRLAVGTANFGKWLLFPEVTQGDLLKDLEDVNAAIAKLRDQPGKNTGTLLAGLEARAAGLRKMIVELVDAEVKAAQSAETVTTSVQADLFSPFTQSLRDSIAVLELQNRMFGQSDSAIDGATTKLKILTDAERDNIAVTDEQQALLDRWISRWIGLSDSLERTNFIRKNTDSLKDQIEVLKIQNEHFGESQASIDALVLSYQLFDSESAKRLKLTEDQERSLRELIAAWETLAAQNTDLQWAQNLSQSLDDLNRDLAYQIELVRAGTTDNIALTASLQRQNLEEQIRIDAAREGIALDEVKLKNTLDLYQAQTLELDQLKRLADASRAWTDALQQGILDLITGARSLSDVLDSLLNMALKFLLFGQNGSGGIFGTILGVIGGAIGGGLGGGGGRGSILRGGKALGGPVQEGVSYLVGERGPETFVPSRDGAILNASQTSAIGNVTVKQTNVFPQDFSGSMAEMILNAAPYIRRSTEEAVFRRARGIRTA